MSLFEVNRLGELELHSKNTHARSIVLKTNLYFPAIIGALYSSLTASRFHQETILPKVLKQANVRSYREQAAGWSSGGI